MLPNEVASFSSVSVKNIAMSTWKFVWGIQIQRENH